MIAAAPLVIPAAEAIWAAAAAIGSALIFVAAKEEIENNFKEMAPGCIEECPYAAAQSQYHPAPKNLPGFPDAKPAKPKTPVQGGGGLRKRWKDSDGDIYEWDSQHGAVERYDNRGKHKGEFDPKTGKQTKPKDKNRKVEP